MQVLLLDDDHSRHEAVMTAFLKAGSHIMATSSLNVAEAILTHGYIDLLIASERLRDRLTHTTALFAEHRNPKVSTVMITDKSGEDADEIYELIPSVHCIVGSEVPAAIIFELGRASVVSQARSLSYSAQDRRSEADQLAEAA